MPKKKSKKVSPLEHVLAVKTATELAQSLGITTQAVLNWRLPGRRIPDTQLEPLYRLTKVPPRLMRPDLDRVMRLG
jgi:hypothetical protein